MRKTIMFAALVALSGAGAVAQARDGFASEHASPTAASRSDDAPAFRGEEKWHERHSASRSERRENHHGYREHDDDERHDERREHGRHR